MSQRLGDLLIKENAITAEQLEQAQKLQQENGGRLGSALVKLGFLKEAEVTTFVSRQYGIPAVDLAYCEIDPAVVKLVPYESAKRYQILPLSRVGSSLTIAVGRSHQRVCARRYQVHDRLQRRAGGRLRERDSGRHRAGLQHQAGGQSRVGHRVAGRRRNQSGTPGRRSRDEPGGSGKGGRPGADRQAGEHDPDGGGQAGRQRHSSGTL